MKSGSAYATPYAFPQPLPERLRLATGAGPDDHEPATANRFEALRDASLRAGEDALLAILRDALLEAHEQPPRGHGRGGARRREGEEREDSQGCDQSPHGREPRAHYHVVSRGAKGRCQDPRAVQPFGQPVGFGLSQRPRRVDVLQSCTLTSPLSASLQPPTIRPSHHAVGPGVPLV